jgi:DNA-binding transcriptional regulator of glucitol operon
VSFWPADNGTLETVRRFLLSPRWLLGHVLVIAAAVAFLWLGRWQWDRAHAADGGAQNVGYALQWPLFALFVIFGWWRVLRLEAGKLAGGKLVAGSAPELAAAPDTPAAPVDPSRRRTVVRRYQPPAVDEDADPELAAYNRHLAELHEQDQRRQR